MTRKHFLILLLACIAPLMSFAADTEIDGIYYTLSGTTATVANQVSSGGDNNTDLPTEIEVPATVTYEETTYDVTALAQYAFRNSDITSIVLPSSITSIGTYAFYNCKSLVSVDLSETQITTVPNYCFCGCSAMTSVLLPETGTLTAINNSAFYNCTALKSINVPYGVTSIAQQAFPGCTSLETVVLPSSLTSVGNNAFQGCTALASVTCYATDAPSYNFSFTGVPSTCTLYVPEGSESSYAETWTQFTASQIVGITEDGGEVLSHALVFDPADGETVVAPLTSITISCAAGFKETGSANGVWITASDDYEGDAINMGSTFTVDEEDGTTCVMTLYSNITDPGTYRIHFPAGVFTLGDDEVESEETSIYITVQAANNDKYELSWDPSGDESVETLTQISFYCPGGFTECLHASQIIVYDKAGNQVTTGDEFTEDDDTEVKSGIDATSVLSFVDGIGDEGTYTVSIPQHVFNFYDANDTDNDHFSEAFEIVYTVTGGEIIPEEGTYLELDVVAGDGDGTAFNRLTISAAGETLDGTIDWEGAATNVSNITVTNENEEVVATGTGDLSYNEDSDENVTSISITLTATVSDEGVYTITIPAGYFSSYNTDGDYIENILTNVDVTVGSNSSFTYEVSPADGGTVYGNLEIVLTSTEQFTVASDAGSITTTNGTATVTCSDAADEDGNYTCTIALSGTEAASNWTITIPAGYFDGQTEAITLTYTLEAARTTSEFTFDPADGGVTMGSVSGLGITANGWVALAAEDVSGLTVTAGEDVSVACKEVTVGEQAADGTTAITCTLASAVSDAGTYTVTIPKGFFYVSTDDATLTNTEAITSTFTIAAIESDPADGAEVTGSLSTITLTSNVAFVLGDDTSLDDAAVTSTDLSETYASVKACEIATDGLSCTLTLDKEVTDSPCELVVPEGYFTFMDDSFTATFTIVESVETGIAGITAAELESANVYNVAGQRVSTLVSGQVNIVRKADGTVKKVLVK